MARGHGARQFEMRENAVNWGWMGKILAAKKGRSKVAERPKSREETPVRAAISEQCTRKPHSGYATVRTNQQTQDALQGLHYR